MRKAKLLNSICIILFFLELQPLIAKELIIYHDADYSVNVTSANAMKMGLLTALDEVGNGFSGYSLSFVEKNHRGNIKRSFRHMQQFLKANNTLFVLGGLHSPPYIKNRDFINQNKPKLNFVASSMGRWWPHNSLSKC